MKFLVFVYGAFCSVACFSQPDELCGISRQLKGDFSTFVSTLHKGNKSDFKTVRQLFFKSHKKFLKNYRAYAQISEIFEKGEYDCLTGTYFLASALDQLRIPFKIYETNYHIFLTVDSDRDEILLECTDPINGFISDPHIIEQKIGVYREAKSNTQNGQLYLSGVRLFHELSIKQLPGLLYFNQAVVAFNKKDFITCCFYLEKAWNIYDNPRIEALTPILIHSIETSSMNHLEKENLTDLLRAHHQGAANSIASR